MSKTITFRLPNSSIFKQWQSIPHDPSTEDPLTVINRYCDSYLGVKHERDPSTIEISAVTAKAS